MLQQTQVTTVIPFYLRFVAEFPDVRQLALADVGRVLELWSGLGYYRRAHLLHDAARTVLERHGGAFPGSPDALEALPGVGRSTAAAIAAFASGARVAILEGNVKRVLARHAGIEGYPGDPGVAATLWRCAQARLPRADMETYTQGMMDLGATLCTRGVPRCLACPVASDCSARQQGRTRELPAPRPRRTLPKKSVTVLLIEQGGRVLLERRPPSGIWSGLWSLPEVAANADAADYCRGRFGGEVRVGLPLAPIEHTFTHFQLTLMPLACTPLAWPSAAAEPGMSWLALADADRAALPAPIKRLLRERAGASSHLT